jgi:tetratricopeptide (TPR) repeat protein
LKKRELDELFDAALKAGDFGRAEEFARATLAQSVIWVKQHTAMTMNVARDLYRQMVEIDMPALEAHIARLRKPLMATGHFASFLPQLNHLSAVIGVPELSIRLMARAAQWLFESGDYAGALEELKRLGDIDQLHDTLALVFATKLLDLPDRKQTHILNRAVAGALAEEEKWFAQLELASHLLACDQRADALSNVDSVIRECRDKNHGEGPLAAALCLRAQITDDNKDVATAREATEVFADLEHEILIGMMLIEHGDFDEAERVLSKALKAKEPVAQLLAIDARLRSGRIDAAHELLLTIELEKISARLLYPYAVTCAFVAVAREDRGLKDQAMAYLRDLPCGGTRIAGEVSGILNALSDPGDSDGKSPLARIRGFLRLER